MRHPAWERLFVSQPDSEPPAAIPGLVREPERRFAWKVELDRLRELPHSHDEGRYIHWLFQNALLLPT